MFWKNFVVLCNRENKTPNAVAEELGLSSGSLTAWKRGRVPRDTTVSKIADYFGVSAEYLLASAIVSEDKLNEALIARLTALTPDEVEKVDAFVQGLLAAR